VPNEACRAFVVLGMDGAVGLSPQGVGNAAPGWTYLHVLQMDCRRASPLRLDYCRLGRVLGASPASASNTTRVATSPGLGDANRPSNDGHVGPSLTVAAKRKTPTKPRKAQLARHFYVPYASGGKMFAQTA